MTRPSTDILSLVQAALDASSEVYADAIAAQLSGQASERQWLTMESVMYRALVLGQLVGIEAENNKVKALGATLTPNPKATFDRNIENDDVFQPAEFNEAIEAFQSRVPILREELPGIAERAKRQAKSIITAERQEALTHLARTSRAINEAYRNTFFVSEVDRSTVVNLKELVAQAIRGQADATGLPLPEFIEQAQLQGARNLTAARLETVYRNNVMAAMNDGQAKILSRPEARRVVPLVMIVEGRDRRTRGNPAGLYPDQGFHFQMNGYINTIDYIEAKGLKPPCGHMCRGSMRGVTNYEAMKLGIVDENGAVIPEKLNEYNGERQRIIDRGDYPDHGWREAA